LILDGDFCIFWEGLLKIWTIVQNRTSLPGFGRKIDEAKKRKIRGKHRTVEK
jgi:hypothetical protein